MEILKFAAIGGAANAEDFRKALERQVRGTLSAGAQDAANITGKGYEAAKNHGLNGVFSFATLSSFLALANAASLLGRTTSSLDLNGPGGPKQ